MKQTTFASMSYRVKKRRTRQEKFLAEMAQVVPWAQLVAVSATAPWPSNIAC